MLKRGATRRGGAIFNLSPITDFAVTANNVDFHNNESTHSSGGAIYNEQTPAGTIGKLKIRQSNFRANTSTISGGIREHVFSRRTDIVTINATKNFWNNPTVSASANVQGVNRLELLTAKVNFTPDPPQVPPVDPCGLRQCPVLTSTPTATPSPVAPTLLDYNITLEGEWSTTERTEILYAANETGRALFLHGIGLSNVDAFYKVLQGLNGTTKRKIRFYRSSELGGVFCKTNKLLSGEYSASIACHPNVNITKYTAVHEFGHVLVGRTTSGSTSAFLIKMESPSGAGTALFTTSGLFVFGPRTIPIQGRSLDDWQRSDYILDNGWGSAAQWDQTSYYTYPAPAVPAPTPTGYPVRIPAIGPCGDGDPETLPPVFGTPFPFQQNPCTFPDELATDPTGPITEIEEAAADMFLNWVYWKNYPNHTDRGFLDVRWRFANYSGGNCYPSGCPDNAFSGQARQTWMNDTLSDLFTEFGW